MRTSFLVKTKEWNLNELSEKNAFAEIRTADFSDQAGDLSGDLDRSATWAPSFYKIYLFEVECDESIGADDCWLLRLLNWNREHS